MTPSEKYLLIIGVVAIACPFARNQTWRKTIVIAALFFVALVMMFGCAAAPNVVGVEAATVAPVAPIRDVPIPTPTVANTVPAERDVLKELLATKASLSEALAGHKEIAAQRQELAEKEARVRAELTAAAAEKDAALARLAAVTKAELDRKAAAEQAEINRKKAETDAANQRAADKAKQEREAAEDAAEDARNMAYALFALGTAGILAGAAVGYFMKQPRLGGFIALVSLGLVLLALNASALSVPVRIAVIGGLIVALVFGIGNAASSLYWDWKTRSQAFKQKQAALDLLTAGKTTEAALMDASSRALLSVASPNYDPEHVSFSERALALIKSTDARSAA